MKKKITMLVFFCFFPAAIGLFGQEIIASASAPSARTAIDINLIIDGTSSFIDVKEEITSWVINRLDRVALQGDRVTVWNAGSSSEIIYTGRINSASDIDAAKKSIREFSVSETQSGGADFSGALKDAASRTPQQSSQSGDVRTFSYTVLISASPSALSSLLSGSQANLLRFSRVEEFSGWRALVVGLNLDGKVRQAAADFFGS